MNLTTSGYFLCLLSFVACTLSYPLVLRLAKRYGFMDNPNERKLQRVPIPVMGGLAVFIGILCSLLVCNIQVNDNVVWVGLAAMVIMLVIGAIDDATDIPASLRFILEIALVYWMTVDAKIGINSFHGLWDIEEIDIAYSLPLSLIAGVGIINAINLIDGVDGYASGFCIMACAVFSVLFFYAGNKILGNVCIICVGALIPFFLHNVFGRTSKMFIGDSGTLMMGTILTISVFAVLSSKGNCKMLESEGIGLVPLTLAILSIPVFDTLRVMGARIVRGVSPFHPDKTHLHHLFIEMGFSHIGTAVCIISLNFLIVVIWFISWKLGASINTQFYIVVSLSLLITFCFYRFMKIQENSGPVDEDGFHTGNVIWRFFCKLGEKTHFEDNSFWKLLRNLMDGRFRIKGKNNE
ncbi:MAG: undecaprenyl/decaprenyl-phosphate alpha-N-acetylglucosaminyl 1-phosphate transferase [Bacteroidaceae bacterium]|nr:undecaprenyl/decaprenyl-phosphate alpha-N-acetylglucosaminyl 1-phosphate transferase [Bacteroidaceae bacterium]